MSGYVVPVAVVSCSPDTKFEITARNFFFSAVYSLSMLILIITKNTDSFIVLFN